MYKILFFLILTSTVLLKAQESSKYSDVVCVNGIKMNVLYIGLENPLSIYCQGVSINNIKVTTDNGEIINYGKNDYRIIPKEIGFCNILIEGANGVKTNFMFRVKEIPYPVLHALNSENKVVCLTSPSLSDIRSFDKLISNLSSFDFWVSYEVIGSFNLTILKNNGKKIEFKLKNFSFTNEIIKLFKSLDSSDLILIDSVKLAVSTNVAEYSNIIDLPNQFIKVP